MLKRLKLTNFTVFADAAFEFASGLNVIVGENGTGKSQLLKVPYCVMATSREEGRKPHVGLPTKAALQTKFAEKLVGVLRPEAIGRLTRRRQGVVRAKIECQFADHRHDVSMHFTTKSKSEVVVDRVPKVWQDKSPVYLPTRELLTIYPNFVSLYDSHYLDFEETWRDTCVLLGAPAVRGVREKSIAKLLEPLEQALGGRVDLDKNGRFYLRVPARGRMEMPLVAEGFRKLAMIARLIATGSLLDKGYLFWDEPEANLNPKLIKLVASTILSICQSGIQVFIASHSLFLMRELFLLQKESFRAVTTRCFGLHQEQDGSVTVQQGKTMDDIGDIASLSEDLMQSDRYINVEMGLESGARPTSNED